VLAYICNPRIWGLRLEDCEFEAILAYIVRPCQKEGRREGRKEGGKEERKEGRKEGILV
jgi:hypothetical protein